MRGLKSTIVLALVLAGLGAYIYFVESERPAFPESERVFDVEANAIEEITVTAEGETTTLRKEDGAWKIVEPIAADADETEATSLASGIAGLEISRVVDEAASNLADYGLAEPQLRLAFKAAGGVTGEIHLGERTPTGGDLYAVQPGETRVFLVPSWRETSLAKKTFDLRDKRVLRFERDKVDTIELSAPGSSPIVLTRSGSDWAVEKPIQARGDYSTIEGLLTRLSTVNMLRIADPNSPENFGFEKPTAAVTVGAGSTRATLEFGADTDGGVYARDTSRELVFAVDTSLANDVKRPVTEYRDKDLFEFRTYTAVRLQLTRGDNVYEFQKVSGTGEDATEKWQRVVDGNATDVDATKMNDLLSKLSNLRAQSFNETTNAAGNAPPELVAAVSYDTDKFERVRFLRGKDEVFGAREGEPGVAVVDRTSFDETLKALDAVVAQ